MCSKNNKISEKVAKEIIKECFTIADFCRKVGWKPCGDNYKIFHKYQKEYNLDISHFIRKINIPPCNGVQKRKSAEEYSKSTYVKSSTFLKKLIEDGVKKWQCECCGNTEWMNDKIPLEIHHIDGNHFNNSIDNIELLCPNCHAKTDNYRGAKNKKTYKCTNCGETISKWNKSQLCVKCLREKQRKVNRPTKEELEKLLNEQSFLSVAKIFNVTDNAVRKWCKYYGMAIKSDEYKKQKKK